MQRDKMKFEDVIKKVRNQWPEEDKVRLADFVIINDGKTSLIPQIWSIHNKLMSKY